MKRKCFFIVLVLGILVSFVACDNSMEVESLNSLSLGDENIEVAAGDSTVSFIYKGVLYTSECLVEKDSIIILNEEVRDIANQLSSLPQLVSYVSNRGVIEYFDNPYMAESWLGNPIVAMSSPMDGRHIINGATATLYDDTDYRDRSFPFTIRDGGQPISVAQFKNKPYEFNDKASSLKIIADVTPIKYEWESAPFKRIVLNLYEDENFGGNSVWFDVCNYTLAVNKPVQLEYKVPSLKSIPLTANSHRNWNDKTTSIILKYIGRNE